MQSMTESQIAEGSAYLNAGDTSLRRSDLPRCRVPNAWHGESGDTVRGATGLDLGHSGNTMLPVWNGCVKHVWTIPRIS